MIYIIHEIKYTVIPINFTSASFNLLIENEVIQRATEFSKAQERYTYRQSKVDFLVHTLQICGAQCPCGPLT